jgi:hypothetical protein
MPRKSKLHNHVSRQRSLAVLARVRRGEPLSQAARTERTTVRTVRKYLGKQLRRDSSGNYRATRGDRLRRDLSVLGFDGYEPIVSHSSKEASLASEHLIAVNRFLRTGNKKYLKPFIGKRVGGVELLTQPKRIQVLGDLDLVKLDGLYRNNPGGGLEK